MIYLKDGKILLARSKGKEVFYLPGGKREQEESDEQTLKREVKEEMSCDLVEGSIKPFGIFQGQADGKVEGTIVMLRCYIAELAQEPCANNEVEELRYFSASDLIDVPETDWQIYHLLIERGLLK